MAQKRLTGKQVKWVCSFNDGDTATDVYVFDPDRAANEAINRILKFAILPINFTLMAADVDNAQARLLEDGRRYILYNQGFLIRMQDKTKNDWAVITVFAHEVAHHILGHTEMNQSGASTVDRPDMELNADLWAGSIMQRMGATYQEVETAMASIADEKASDTHPARRARIAAITSGWVKARDITGGVSRTTREPSTPTGPVRDNGTSTKPTNNVTGGVGAAIANLMNGKLDEAKIQIDNAVNSSTQGGKSKTWFYRGEVYRLIAGDPTGVYSRLEPNAVQIAYDSYRKAQKLEPGSIFAKQAAEKQSELSALAINEGAAKFHANDYKGAAKAFELARQLDSKDTTAALYAAYSYINTQDKNFYAKAADALQVVINGGSKDPAKYVTLIDLLQAIGHTIQAEEVATQAVRKFPNNKDVRDKQFNLLIANNNTVQARANLLEAIKREPNNAVYLKNLGILYDQSGDKTRAIEYYERSLAVDPNNYDANFNLGVLHYNRGADISKVIRDMDLKQYQKDGKRLEGEAKGHFRKALPYFEANYKANAKDVNVLEPLKSIYTVLDRKADAERIDRELQKAK